MNFLYPAFLFGLFALAIPVIIHLFNFRKTKKIYFSNNQFLKNIKDAQSPKYKLKHFLVLSSRLLFLTFLVLAFAQPFIPGQNENITTKNVLIYLDNSYSMLNETENGRSAFDVGTKYVTDIVNLYPAGTKFKLLTNDFAPFSNFFKSRNDIQDHITELGFSAVSRSFDEINSRLLKEKSALKGDQADIFWISDFQKSTTGNLDNWKNDTLHKHFFVPVNFINQSNIFVDTLYLTNPFLIANETNQLEVVLQNTSKENVDDLIVKLYVNEKQVASSSVDLKANGRNHVKFELNANLEKYNACRVSFEDFPVSFDNDFYFNLNLSDRIKVLEIKSGEANRSITNVFANQSLFIYNGYRDDNLDYSAINSSDVIVLNQLKSIDATLLPFLQDFKKAGGTLVLIPSKNPDIDSYNRLFGINVVRAETNLTSAKLVSPDIRNPFFKDVFVESDKAFEMPEAKNIITWNARGMNLLIHKDGRPFLSLMDEAGAVYLIGSPLHEDYTTLQKHALFVPVMYKIAARSKSMNEKLYSTLNESILKLTIDSLVSNSIYKLVQNEKELIPAQRIIDNELFLELPKYTLNTGFYNLTLNDQPQKVVAFNHDKKESLLDQYRSSDLRKLFAGRDNVSIYDTKNIDAFTNEMKEKHMGIPLWKYALIFALLFMLTEVLLIRFMR